MEWHRLRLTLRGPTGTLWQADTIFGHLCWALRHRRGEAALQEFLGYFWERQPLFLLSDGFPGDLLPMPVGIDVARGEGLEGFRAARESRKLKLLPRKGFIDALKGAPFVPGPAAQESALQGRRVVLKNLINRATGTTGGEGQLFPFTEHWTPSVTIYLKIEPGFQDEVRELFEWVAETGYGKRKSVGYGAIDSLSLEPFEGFPVPERATGFVSLSPFVPAAGDPVQGRWRTLVKYGKLGEDFAIGDNPFKRPLLMLTAGSAFLDSPLKELYGRMVPGLSAVHPEAVQYGYALPVPMILPADWGAEAP